MTTRSLYKTLKKFILLIVLLFVFFILSINIVKILDYKNKINLIFNKIKLQGQILPIKAAVSYDQITQLPDNSIAHTAYQMGYKNDLQNLNGTEWGNGINFLLVGSDKKDFTVKKARSDVIIVLRITTSGKILSISIPRDSLILINDGKWAGKKDKIGHSLYWGGIDNLKNNVENLLGTPIYKIVIIDNFRSFEAILAILGGINIDKYLYGDLSVQWIRNRQFKYGDIERCRRQQIFLKKTVEKTWRMTNLGNIFLLNIFYDNVKKLIKTDISKDELFKIVYILKKNNFDPKIDFLTGVLPGRFSKYNSYLLKRNNLDCWILDEKNLSNIQFLLYSERKKDFISEINKKNIFDFVVLDLFKLTKAKQKG